MDKKELSKGFTGIEINGVRFSNIKEMLIYMNKQRVRIINLENENAEAKEMIKKLLSRLNRLTYTGLNCEECKEAEQFLKDSEVEK